MNNSKFLALTLDAQILKITMKLTNGVNRKLTNVNKSTTKLAGIGSAWEQDQQHSTGEVCWKY